VTGVLVALNRSGIYRPLPYAVVGMLLWVCLHDAGLHATLACVILAVLTPTRPPANVQALMTQAQLVIHTETPYAGDAVMHHGLSTAALRTLDTIHDRLESPADKLLRSIEPWSSFAVLPLFAFAKIGIFIASITAACAGVAILWNRAAVNETVEVTSEGASREPAQ